MIVLEVIGAILIEALFFMAIPLLIRLIGKRPLSPRIATYIAVINYAVIFAIFKIIILKSTNINYYSISPDLLSLLLVPVNVFILRFDKNNPKLKKKIFILVAIITAFLGTILISSFFIDNGITEDKPKEAKVYQITELKEKDYNKVINSKKTVVVLYTANNCIYCEQALDVIKELTVNYRLENIYYYPNYVNDIEKYPTLAIYQNNELLDKLEGFSDKKEIPDQFYRLDVINLLSDYDIITD